MRVRDVWQESWSAISGNKARSSLTILGIVIGISSVITLVAVGQGATASVTSNISSLGSNLLQVRPGAQRGFGGVSGGAGTATTLTAADVDAMKKEVTAASAIAPELTRRYQVTAPGTNTNTSVTGTDPSYTQARSLGIDLGSFITDRQVQTDSKVAVLGPTARDTLFGQDANAIGQTIKINKISFKVIGVVSAKGGSGFTNPDETIYIPISAAQRFLAGGKATITTVNVEADSKSDINLAQQQITNTLLARHHISDPSLADFSVLNQADLVSSLSSVSTTLTILLGTIAGISLLVGGIGIMNMMLTTVTERTREIGLRKAVGAKRGAITIQFLSESVMLTFIGGSFGVAIGTGAAALVSKYTSYHATVTWWSIVLAFGVSALVGVLFGYYPARRAAKLRPIDALKYE